MLSKKHIETLSRKNQVLSARVYLCEYLEFHSENRTAY